MKRFLLFVVAVGLMVSAIGFSGGPKAKKEEFQVALEKRNPWTHLRLNNDAANFHFVVVSDRTGGNRGRIFSQAMDQINLLQPSFVMSVGDLIQGYSKDRAVLANEWKELQSYVAKLKMPFFYVPGNHDLSNKEGVGEWKDRFGKSYYHFLYRDVLFLAVASDDEGEDKEYGQISMEQVNYFKKVLGDNKNVRWTIVCMHKPVWSMPKMEKNNFPLIEKELAGRPYTVFAGHVHRYEKTIRNGMNYYQLATTGGGSKMRGLEYREFDHITWVTMTKDGPVMANILADGVLPEDLKRPVSTEEGVPVYNRKQPYSVKGTLQLEGTPMAGAMIALNALDAKTKKTTVVSDGMVQADGSFSLSSYKPNDGAPAGEYIVTVVWRTPQAEGQAKAPNRAPERYASAATSNLKFTVKSGQNELNLNLTK